jgi:hypothetical protein
VGIVRGISGKVKRIIDTNVKIVKDVKMGKI